MNEPKTFADIAAAQSAMINSPHRRAISDLLNSPHQKAITDMLNSPAQRETREMIDSPGLRALRNLYNSPGMQATALALRDAAIMRRPADLHAATGAIKGG